MYAKSFALVFVLGVGLVLADTNQEAGVGKVKLEKDTNASIIDEIQGTASLILASLSAKFAVLQQQPFVQNVIAGVTKVENFTKEKIEEFEKEHAEEIDATKKYLLDKAEQLKKLAESLKNASKDVQAKLEKQIEALIDKIAAEYEGLQEKRNALEKKIREYIKSEQSKPETPVA